jgi:hypothetical protein
MLGTRSGDISIEGSHTDMQGSRNNACLLLMVKLKKNSGWIIIDTVLNIYI